MGDGDRHYRNLFLLASADGSVDPRERGLLDRCAAAIGLAAADVGRIESEPAASRPELALAASSQDRLSEFMSLLRLVAADGRVAPEERALLERYLSAARIEGLDLDTLLAEVSRPSGGGSERVYWTLALAAYADGTVTPEERQILEEQRVRLGLAPEPAAGLEALAREGKEPPATSLPTLAEKLDSLILAVRMVTADGRLDPRERLLVERLWRQAGLTEVPLDRLLASCLGKAWASLAGSAGAPGGAGEGEWRPVHAFVDGLSIDLPNRCACCLAAADLALEERAPLRGVKGAVSWARLAVPYCARCRRHVQARARRGRLAVFASLSLVGAWALLSLFLGAFLGAGVVEPWRAILFWAGAPIAAALGGLAIACLRHPLDAPGPPHACEGAAVRILDADVGGLKIWMANSRYAALARSCNASTFAYDPSPSAGSAADRPSATLAAFGRREGGSLSRLIRCGLVLAFTLAAGGWVIWSCGRRALWEKVCASGNPGEIQRHLDAFGAGPATHLEEAYAEWAQRSGVGAALALYVKRFPQGAHRARVETFFLDRLARAGSAQEVDAFWNVDPDPMAVDAIEGICAEWALREGTEAALTLYGRRCLPGQGGATAPKHRRAAAEALLALAERSGSEDAIDRWLAVYGDQAETLRRADAEGLRIARTQGSTEAFTRYARAFPHGVGIADAEDAVAKSALQQGSLGGIARFLDEIGGSLPGEGSPLEAAFLRIAIASGDKPALRDYLRRFPDAKGRAQVEARYRALAEAEGTIAALDDFCEAFPSPSDASAIEGKYADAAITEGSRRGMRGYARRFPTGASRRRVADAFLARVSGLSGIEAFCDAFPECAREAAVEARYASLATQRPSAELADAYLLRFPDGKHRSEVADAWFSEVLRDPTPRAIREWASRFPDMCARADDSAWEAARLEDEPRELGEYLSMFPQGKHRQEAERRGIEIETTERSAAGGLPVSVLRGKTGQSGVSMIEVENGTGATLTASFTGPEVFRLCIAAGDRVALEMKSGRYRVGLTLGGGLGACGGGLELADERRAFRLTLSPNRELESSPLGVEAGGPPSTPDPTPMRRIGEDGELGPRR